MKTFDPFHHNAEALLAHWINQAPGAFSIHTLGVSQMDKDAEFQLTLLLETLVDIGFLEHYGKKRGWYIKSISDVEIMDLESDEALSGDVDVWLPFWIPGMVKIFPGNIIIFSGFKGSGKTAISLNTAQENRAKGWNVHYFNSEMGVAELRERLNLSDITIDMWQDNCVFYRRAREFHNVIRPGKNNLNIIDFYEIHDDFYTTGRDLKAIHDKLDGAVCIINIQKNPGIDTPPLGGWRSLEVCRVCLSIDSGKVKLKVAKNWRDIKENPEQLMKDFKLVGGYKLISPDRWYREQS